MGTNTGFLDWFLHDFGIGALYELNDPGFFPFGAKYVHSPTIAKLAMDAPFEELGKPFDEKKLVKLNLEEGTILHIDNFGLMKIFGKLPEANDGDKFKISTGSKEFVATYSKRMMSLEAGEWVIYPGSSFGFPELGKVRENGAWVLGLDVGDRVFFEKQ